MLYIFDKDENLLEILSSDEFWDDIYKRQLNKEWSFTASVSVNTSNIKRRNKVGFYDRDNVFQLFTIDEVSDIITLDDDEKIIYAPHDFYKLGEKIIEDRRVINGSCREALEKALDGTIYKVGEVADLGLNTLNFYYITSLEALNKIVESYGGELNFRLEMNEDKTSIANRYVDILYRQGEDTGIRYTLDTNIVKLKRNDIIEGLYNVLYGRGSSLETEGGGYTRLLDFADISWSKPTNPSNKPLGQKYIEDVESIQRYGRIEGIYENKDIDEPSQLLQSTYDALQECKDAKYNYSAKVEDISNIEEYSHFKARLGDTIHILDEEYDFNEECRIIEEKYPISDMNDIYIEMGYFLPGITDISPNLPGGGNITTGNENKPEIDIENFPDTLPSVPILNVKSGFASIALDWTYENKLYYDYEVYASQLENFTPDPSNLIFRGKASVLLHEVKPSQTWYYRVRAVNSHGRYTEYSSQVSASTKKISDAAEYFEELAIKDALIGELRLDRGWIGQLDATYLNVKGNFSVTDGNNVKTIEIDSFGRVHIRATTFILESGANTNMASKSEVSKAIKEESDILNKKIEKEVSDVNDYIFELGEYLDGAFKDSILDEQEKEVLRGKLIELEKEKNDVIAQINVLNTYLELIDTDELAALNASSDLFIQKHEELINAIRIMLDGPIKKVESIKLDFSKLTLEEGISKVLTASVLPVDANNKNIEWTSTNTNVATIDSNGIVTAKTAGTTKIKAKSTDGSNIESICNVTVEVKETDLKIHFIKSNTTGDCILIQSDNGKNILVDSNEKSSAQANINYMKKVGVKNLDYIFVTHHHSDHCDAMPEIIDAFITNGCTAIFEMPDWSKLPAYEINEFKTNEVAQRFLNKVKERGIKELIPTEKQKIQISKNTYIEIYNTKNTSYNNYNNLSLVLLVVHKNKKYCLLSDIYKDAQTRIKNSIGTVDVIKVNHHDYDRVSDDEIYHNLNFKDAIITRIEKFSDNRARAFSGFCQYYEKRYFGQYDHGTIVLTSNGNSYSLSSKVPSLYTNAWWNWQDKNHWYYFKSDGRYARNESININGKVYNFNNIGLCLNP